MTRVMVHFSGQFGLTLEADDVAVAVAVYRLAEQRMGTSTRQEFKAEGYMMVSDELFAGGPYLAYRHDASPFVIKPLAEREAARIITHFFHEALLSRGVVASAPPGGQLQGGPELPHDFTQCHPSSIIPFSSLWSRDGQELGVGHTFMLMPKLQGTLDLVPSLFGDAVPLWQNMRDAFSFLHSMSFAHCDVMPANIGIMSAKAFVLIDLGSIAPFGSSHTDVTCGYVPNDIMAGPLSEVVFSPDLDWWMLAVTLAEKCCEVPYDTGSGTCTWSKARVLAYTWMMGSVPTSFPGCRRRVNVVADYVT